MFNIRIINFSDLREKKKKKQQNSTIRRLRFQFLKYYNNGNGFEPDLITRLEHTRGSHSLTAVIAGERPFYYIIYFIFLPLPDDISHKL